MPNLFRSTDGALWKAGDSLPLHLADGTPVEGVWAGSAMEEKLDWWLRRSAGAQFAQTAEVAAVASKAEDTGEMIWGDAPSGARLFFVLLAREAGKSYRLAKMVTTAATPAQTAWFRHDRVALFGTLRPDGAITKIPPLQPPAPIPPAQAELF